MCPECLGTNIKFEQYDFGVCSETGYHDAGKCFTCQDCGWYGDTNDFSVPCSACKRSTPWAVIELDKDCNVVCRECYLANVPQEDIDGALHDAAVALMSEGESNTLGGVQWLQ
jgi:hypothetical protein